MVSVLLFHAGYSHFAGGFVGVDVFFVISGYLITGIIVKDRSSTLFEHLKDFYTRRIRRIFPALLTVLAASLAAGWFLLLPADYEALARQALAGALFVPNFLFWSEAGYFDKAAELKPLLHLWSLGIEEQFYLLWPVVVYYAKRSRFLTLILTAITAVSFACCIYLTATDPTSAFYLPHARVWELSVGGLLATTVIKPNPRAATVASTLGLLALLVSVFTFKPGAHFPGALAAIPVLGTAALIWSGPSTIVAVRLLSLRPIVYAGLISYPLYLWHWPIISLIRQSGWSVPRSGILLLSAILAALTYELIERRIRHTRASTTSISLLSAMAASAMMALFVVISQGFYSRYPADVASILKTMKYDYGPDARLYECWLVDEKGPQQFPPSCTEPRGANGLLIVGDSHAARLYPGLARTLDGSPVWQVTTSSCLPSGGSSLCNRTRDYAIKIAAEQKPRTVVLFAAWVNYSSDWSYQTERARSLGATIDRFTMTGTRVIVLGPAPIWNPSLPVAAFRHWKDTNSIPGRLVPADDRVLIVGDQIRDVSERHGANYISVRDLLCVESNCVVHAPGKPGDLISWDYGHLTTAGSVYLARMIVDSPGFRLSASPFAKAAPLP